VVRRKRKTTKKTDATDYSQVVKKIRPVGEKTGNLKALFYGRQGTGKTTLAATFPHPIIFLDMREEGEDSIADLGHIAEIIEIEKWEEVEQMYWYLKSGDHHFKTVVIDTVTQMQGLKMAQIRELNNKGPDDLITKSMWGTISGGIQTWVLNFRDLPMNVVFLGQDRINRMEEEDDESDEQLAPEVGAAVMPSVAKTLNAAVKVIGQTYLKEVMRKKGGKIERDVEYRLRLGPHAIYNTKIRKPKPRYLPEYIVNPKYDEIVKIIKGEYQPPKKTTKKKKGKVKK